MAKTKKRNHIQLLAIGLAVISSISISQFGYSSWINGYAVDSIEMSDSALEYIGEEVAKATALEDAGIQESDIKYANVWIAYDKKVPQCYKVEFESKRVMYKYEIDLYSNRILEKWLEDCNNEDTSETDLPGTKPSEIDTTITNPALTYISEEVAKATALEDAGIQESDIKYINVWIAYDKKVPQCYKVEFESKRVMYKYEIDLYSDRILEKWLEDCNNEDTSETDLPGTKPSEIDTTITNSALTYISEEVAKATALEDAGIQESDIKYANVWMEYTKGQPSCYVVKFGQRYEHGIRYKYEIDLYSGEVLTASTEYYGDMNSDNDISVSDVIILQKYLLGSKSLTKEEYEIADINVDGLVNIFDLVYLKRELLSK